MVQPEGTPAHVATLTTAELDTVCVEMDRYLAAFSHHARAAPEPLRAIAEQAWFNMNAMFTVYLRELEGRAHRDNAADGDLAQRFPGRSMDNGRCPRSPRVGYGPRERPRKSGPHKNLTGQGQPLLQGVLDSGLTMADSFQRAGRWFEPIRNYSAARFHGGIHYRVVWQQNESEYDRGTHGCAAQLPPCPHVHRSRGARLAPRQAVATDASHASCVQLSGISTPSTGCWV